MEKKAFEEDAAYLQKLEDSIKILKEQEDKLAEEIEHEQIELDKDNIEVEECYKDNLDLLRDFEEVHKLLHSDVEHLINIYADAAEMKGPSIVWTQMPLELCKNQTEMYINYLSAYIKRRFGNNSRDEHTGDSDYDTFTEDSRDRRGEEMLQELSTCLRKLTTSRFEEVTAKVSADACAAIEELAINIYNNGSPRLPQSQAQLELEVVELSGRRDFLEENVRLLRENRLEESITQSSELVITEIVLQDAQSRYEQRERRLFDMLRLRELASEHGHAHSDLLCMLMELQYRRLMEALEIVADARHYLATEYLLSSTRNNVMLELQAEYETTCSDLPAKTNVYNKIFISMMNGDPNDRDSMALSMRLLKQLVVDNDANEEKMFGIELAERINGVKLLEEKVNEVYERETNSGPSSSLKPMSFVVALRTEEAEVRVSQLQNEVSIRRNRLKEKLRKNCDGFEWESTILWQRFLADPNSMSEVYQEAQRRLEQLHYASGY
ncbi:uncharacterized protein LOC105688924 isoform X2 [Athalia rosae]|nr:uncharacterized protein LOC105688924 isoform X2 [Athalia rosae]